MSVIVVVSTSIHASTRIDRCVRGIFHVDEQGHDDIFW